MQDKYGKEIKPGQTLRRIVDAPAAISGTEYTVIQYDWNTGGEGEDLIAECRHKKELLWPERALEFAVINDVT